MRADVEELVKSVVSNEALRWSDEQAGEIVQGPTDEGNAFDISMLVEYDSTMAAKKIADVLARRGVCLCEAALPSNLACL